MYAVLSVKRNLLHLWRLSHKRVIGGIKLEQVTERFNEDLPKNCQECEVNKSEFVLVNGQEKENLCEICIQESIWDLIDSNLKVTFKRKLNVIEVV